LSFLERGGAIGLGYGESRCARSRVVELMKDYGRPDDRHTSTGWELAADENTWDLT
jgi:hypothetical protein